MSDSLAPRASAIDVSTSVRTKDSKVRVSQALRGDVDVSAVSRSRAREEDGLTLCPDGDVIRDGGVELHGAEVGEM